MKAARFLLMTMLVLAVPFQGVLAVSSGQCMALDHHGAASSDSHDHGDSHSDGDGHDHAQNSHCAPSVAISAAVQVLVPEARAESAVAALPSSFSGVLPQTLDRPPLAL